jgi:D-proline reductase (dithiol) PrdB
MVRLNQMDPDSAKHLAELPCPTYESRPFVTGPPLAQRRLALISTAGLHLQGHTPFGPGAADYRVIPGSAQAKELVMSHISTNYDRTGYLQDVNVVFPLERLNELKEEGVIGSLADFHFSFMGATEPQRMEQAARDLAGLMKADGVEAVLLVPV